MRCINRAEAARLHALAVAGRTDARDRLILAVWPLVMREARRFAGRDIAIIAGLDAGDLASSAAVDLIKRLPKFDPDRAALSTWAPVEARSAFYAAVRRAGHHPRPVGDCDVVDPKSLEGSADDRVRSRERAEAVRAAVAGLAPSDREVAERVYFAGESAAEVARSRGQSRDGCRRTMARTNRQLREAPELVALV